MNAPLVGFALFILLVFGPLSDWQTLFTEHLTLASVSQGLAHYTAAYSFWHQRHAILHTYRIRTPVN